MEIKEMLANAGNYTKGRKQAVQYIVVHYTANNGDRAESNGKYFQQPNRNASAHYFVDENDVVQSVKDSDTAWHCGAKSYKHDKCRNDNSIGVEMCSEKDSSGLYYINEATQKKALEVVKWLMEKYSVPLENVLRHYDITGSITFPTEKPACGCPPALGGEGQIMSGAICKKPSAVAGF